MNHDLFRTFISLCSKEDVSLFSNERKLNLGLLNDLGVGLCTSDVMGKLKEKYEHRELVDNGFINSHGFTYFNRIIIPFNDTYFSARSLKRNDPTKNLFPKGMKKELYFLKGDSKNDLYIVEGETDAIRLKQEFNDSNIVGVGGAQAKLIFEDIIKIISKSDFKRVIFAYDNDQAGRKAFVDIIELLTKHKQRNIYENKLYRLIFDEKYKDIDEFFVQGNNKDLLKYENVELDKDNDSIYDIETIPNISDTIKKGVPEINYVVDPFLREGGLTIIGGEPGTKKSILAKYISICIAKGVKLFDKFNCKKKRVMYLDFENGLAVIINRFNAMLLANFCNNMTDIDKVFYMIFPPLKLDEENSIKIIDTYIKKVNPDVFIIDSLVRCMVGQEDKASDVRKVFDNLRGFMADGKSFIILHHTNKTGRGDMNSLRGSSDLGGMAEIILMLSLNGQFTNIKIAKHRHLGIDGEHDFGFMIQNTPEDEDDVSSESYMKLIYSKHNPDEQDAITTCVDDISNWLDDTYTKGDIFKSSKVLSEMSKIGHKKNTIYESLNKLLESKLIKKGQKRGYWVANNVYSLQTNSKQNSLL